MELSHQLKMWPFQAEKRPTRSSAALTVVCLLVLDGQGGPLSWLPCGYFHAAEFILYLLNWSLAFSTHSLVPVALVQLSVCLSPHTQSLPTVLRFTTNGHKED